MSAGEMRVVPTDLRMSASTVDFHADDLRSKHGAADGRIEAAQRGVPSGAAAALSTAVERWQTDSSVLFASLVRHSTGLQSGAAAYEGTDERSAENVAASGDAIPSVDLGL
ncbi:hypothetical protein [Mycolicibacterium hodleri]|uniref:ESX-1 secretion-associated protein n=1 Tax=Mycolicibacterium hodleri TaxID=49897 RepID=A0A502EHE7_9MYCO|nr:hypothetical protein [Mycolicibacterium hodleri]TPG37153.1 hypothetical protein EAH80_04755 [Mycolicibacterium hodleri]